MSEIWEPISADTPVAVGDVVRRNGVAQRLRVTSVTGDLWAGVVPIRKDGQRDQRYYVGWSGYLIDHERLVLS